MQLLNEMQDSALATGEDIGLHRPGSIRLIEKGNRDRYIEAMQHVAMAKIYDSNEPNLGEQALYVAHPPIFLKFFFKDYLFFSIHFLSYDCTSYRKLLVGRSRLL